MGIQLAHLQQLACGRLAPVWSLLSVRETQRDLTRRYVKSEADVLGARPDARGVVRTILID